MMTSVVIAPSRGLSAARAIPVAGTRRGVPTRRWITRASSSSSSTEDEDATSTSEPKKKIGRFVRKDPTDATTTSAAPYGSGPGDVGSKGVAPPPSTMNIKVIPLEDTGFQGVAKPAVEETESEIVFRQAQLVGGDVVALLAFAAIGRGNHGEGLAALDVLATAAPFAVGWFGASKFADTFGKDARGDDAVAAAVTAGKAWIVGVPAGLVLRALGKGAAPPAPFVLVSMTFTGALLIGWRYWFANQKAQANGTMVGGNKRGNPLEFMQLLFGLVKRW